MLIELSESEKYLWAILSDHSGLDLAEFSWPNPEDRDTNCFRAWPFQWCFAGETKVITKGGIFQIKDLVDQKPVLLSTGDTGKSIWVDSEVKSFGYQQIWEIDLVNSGLLKTIRTTKEHKWFADSNKNRARRRYLEMTTDNLSPGVWLKSAYPEKVSKYSHRDWKVIDVRETDIVEEVYCAVVPKYHRFVLDDFILTSNCWWRDDSLHQIDCSGRSVGKSLSIKVRSYGFPFIHPNEGMLITAPEGNHLDAITGVIETSFMSNRLGREMISSTRTGITHRPFTVNFKNGAHIDSRIPQRDGKGVKGQHPIWLELDEAQDYPKPGWTELFETLKQGHRGSMWRAHGVTRGLRDEFYKFTQPDSGWKVHKITAMHRPTWTDKERQDKIAQYGSKDHPDYRRNILGAHGDATNPMFVLHRLMQTVDSDIASAYNDRIYTKLRINNEMVLEYNDDILPLIDFPASHLKFKHTWIGMDVGFASDPSEILVFAEEIVNGSTESKLRLITRIALQRINHENQAKAILYLINFYKPHVFAMDKTGLGLPLFQDIQTRAGRDPNIKGMLDHIKGYNFSEKILVELDSTIELEEYDDAVKEAGIKRKVLEQSTDVLRDLVDSNRLILPYDKELLSEFQGQTFTYDKSTMDIYGRARRFNTGSFHTLDAARMAVLGWSQHKITAIIKEKETFIPSPTIILI